MTDTPTVEQRHLDAAADAIDRAWNGNLVEFKPLARAFASFEESLPQQPRPDASVDGLAGELAHEIESLYAEATSNPCTCNVDENACPYCNAWSKAIDESWALIRAALKEQS